MSEEQRQPGGQPRNLNAKRNRPWRDAIDRAIAQNDGKKLRAAADKLLDLAEAGDVAAIKELGDRLDGKSLQRLAGDDESPLQVIVRKE